ncbi:MAG: helix-turn-helix domain-containing protein [Oscillospiraceae bacterium]|nr:helix-turn-helix domain-containing protein [Oscillospiraceae bacterium]
MEERKNCLAQRLRELRNDQGISQYKLADALGLSRGLLSNYEQGTREPDYNTLLLLANYYDVSLDYLLGASNVRKRFMDKQTQARDNQLVSDIFTLSDYSYTQLQSYIDLLKLHDQYKGGQAG